MRFQNLDEALGWLYERKKSVVGLHDFQRFLDAHGNPERKLKAVHVAGTNGKGSTTAYIASILRSQGYKVGTFTSPHLVTHNDRIRINNVPIPDDDLLQYLEEGYGEFADAGLSMFEIDFYIACEYFLEKHVDFAVIEVGLGGEFDATNTVWPMVSVITTIGYDHMAYLGNTLEKIASAKAGIIKEGIPVITHVKDTGALRVIEDTASARHAELTRVKDPFDVHEDSEELVFSYGRYRNLRLQTMAYYQAENASNALETVKVLRNAGVRITPRAVRKGLYEAIWEGRFEKVSDDPEVILDGAHNEEGIRALTRTLKMRGKDCVIVFAALKDKMTDRMIESLLEVTDDIIVTEFVFSRDQKADVIAKDYPVTVEPDYGKAIRQALSRTGKTVIITGSLYFISLVRKQFFHP